MRTDHAATLSNALRGLVLALVTTVSAYADKTLSAEFDLSEVTVEFKVKLLGVIPVIGQFREVRGSLVDPAWYSKPGFNITVFVDSVDTRNSERDRLLRSDVFFDVERFPSIRFNDIRLISTDNGARYLVGKLTMHGVSRPVVFGIVEPTRQAANAADTPTPVAAQATIKRSTFGLDAFPLVISDEVEITVRLDGDLAELHNRFRRVSSGERHVSAWPQ